MTFPKILLITDSRFMAAAPDSAILAACLGGAKWFCVRDKSAPPREILEIFARTQRIAEKFGAKTYLNGRADLARAAHADGLHLPETEISVPAARLTVGFHTPCGVSVHSLEAAKRAATEGANYLIFGPIFETPSHPETLPVGLSELRKVAESVDIPVFAIGGISALNAAQCLDAGAAGVAVISAVWGAQNVTGAVKHLRETLGEIEPPRHGHGPLSEAPATGLAARLAQSRPASDIILENGNGSS